jgi:hypothetical protein
MVLCELVYEFCVFRGALDGWLSWFARGHNRALCILSWRLRRHLRDSFRPAELHPGGLVRAGALRGTRAGGVKGAARLDRRKARRVAGHYSQKLDPRDGLAAEGARSTLT